MTTDKQPWTVCLLIAHLNTLPQDKPIILLDADTGYIIDKFAIDDDANEITFLPCDYNEMR